MVEGTDDPQVELPELPWIARRADIPVSTAATDVDAEVRHILSHPSLGPALADAAALLSWIELGSGRELEPRFHDVPSLLVVLHGSAVLTADAPAVIEAGDVVTIPAKNAYGLSSVGTQGLRALHVTFPDAREAAYSLNRLLERNLLRCHAILETPYFRLLRDGGLNAASRARFMECLRIFSDEFQVFLFTRQAMCREDSFRALFAEHLAEEFGHNLMLQVPQDSRIVSDPILKATSSWFCQRMLVLDNAGKFVVNLVLETAGYHFHSLARPVFKGESGERYFDTHAEADEHHKDMGVELLQGLHPDTYEQLYRVLEDSYDMLEAMTQRMIELSTTEDAERASVAPRASDIREILPALSQNRRSHG